MQELGALGEACLRELDLGEEIKRIEVLDSFRLQTEVTAEHRLQMRGRFISATIGGQHARQGNDRPRRVLAAIATQVNCSLVVHNRFAKRAFCLANRSDAEKHIGSIRVLWLQRFKQELTLRERFLVQSGDVVAGCGVAQAFDIGVIGRLSAGRRAREINERVARFLKQTIDRDAIVWHEIGKRGGRTSRRLEDPIGFGARGSTKHD